jgi:hypothetical protein
MSSAIIKPVLSDKTASKVSELEYKDIKSELKALHSSIVE